MITKINSLVYDKILKHYNLMIDKKQVRNSKN